MNPKGATLTGKRGKVYVCLKCGTYQGERRRVVKHIYYKHVKLEEAPFYCSLCEFRAVKEKELEAHTKKNKIHQNKLKSVFVNIDERSYLKKSERPYLIGNEDMAIMSDEHSEMVWAARKKNNVTSEVLISGLGSSSGIGVEVSGEEVEVCSEVIQDDSMIQAAFDRACEMTAAEMKDQRVVVEGEVGELGMSRVAEVAQQEVVNVGDSQEGVEKDRECSQKEIPNDLFPVLDLADTEVDDSAFDYDIAVDEGLESEKVREEYKIREELMEVQVQQSAEDLVKTVKEIVRSKEEEKEQDSRKEMREMMESLNSAVKAIQEANRIQQSTVAIFTNAIYQQNELLKDMRSTFKEFCEYKKYETEPCVCRHNRLPQPFQPYNRNSLATSFRNRVKSAVSTITSKGKRKYTKDDRDQDRVQHTTRGHHDDTKRRRTGGKENRHRQ